MLTEEQRHAYRAALESFQRRTLFSRLKKAAVVLLLCLLGVWVAMPSTPPDVLSPKIEEELKQTRIQFAESEKKRESLIKERTEFLKAQGQRIPNSFGLNLTTDWSLKDKIRQLEKDLEVAKQPQKPRVTLLGKILTSIFAAGLWLYLIAHTFDGGFKKDEEDEQGGSFAFQYLCSPATLKDNLLELVRRLGELLAKGGKMLKADMSSQFGCVVGAVVVLVGLWLLTMASVLVLNSLHFFALVTMLGSTWLLLGWLIWCRPIQIRLREITATPDGSEYERGSQLYEMPDASSASPGPLVISIAAGEYLNGKVTLFDDGSYALGTMTVDQASGFDGVTINGVTISKTSGEGQEIKFQTEGNALRVIFTKGQWWQAQ